MTHLIVSEVTLTFGGLHALSNVDISIEPGLITSIIGPNGAGKTSILNCISGFYHPTKGEIHYGERNLTHASPHQVSNMGIARAFQNLELFRGLSVLDNLLLARHHLFWQGITPGGRKSLLCGKSNRLYGA
jgi:branched-chain amino acid transport system ATP-binding protein